MWKSSETALDPAGSRRVSPQVQLLSRGRLKKVWASGKPVARSFGFLWGCFMDKNACVDVLEATFFEVPL